MQFCLVFNLAGQYLANSCAKSTPTSSWRIWQIFVILYLNFIQTYLVQCKESKSSCMLCIIRFHPPPPPTYIINPLQDYKTERIFCVKHKVSTQLLSQYVMDNLRSLLESSQFEMFLSPLASDLASIKPVVQLVQSFLHRFPLANKFPWNPFCACI